MRGARARRWLARLAAVLGLAALGGGLAAVVLAGRSESPPPATRVAAAPKPKPKPRSKPVAAKPKPKAKAKAKPAAPKPVRLTAVAAYDPEGDGHEKDELAGQASDGDAATYWTSETYSSWGWKTGIGLVLDAGRPVELKQLVVVTDEPGWKAQIRAGASPQGPFAPVSASRTTTGTTVFALREAAPRRYRLIWITQLGAEPTTGGSAHVNEVRARA